MPNAPQVPYNGLATVSPETQQPNDYLRVQASPQDFGSQVGGALQQFGQTTENVAAKVNDVAIQYAEQYNNHVADQGYNDLASAAHQTLYGNNKPGDPNEHGFLATEGANAMSGAGPAMQAMEQKRQDIMNSLPNDRAKLLFDQQSRRLNLMLSDQIGNHADQQFRVYGQKTQQATQDISLAGIAANPADENAFNYNLDRATKAATAAAVAAGGSPEMIQSAQLDARSKAFYVRADTMGESDPVAALKFATDHQSEFTGTTFASLAEKLKPKAYTKMGQQIADSVVGGGGGGGALPAASNITDAIYQQESGGGRNNTTSVTGARGGMQIQPATFQQYAKPGESIDNPADNKAVGQRIIDDLSQKAGGDPARIAVGYFSGPGNIAPPGSPTPYLVDKTDPTGKSTSSYVSDILGRLGKGGASNPTSSSGGPQPYPDITGMEQKVIDQTAGNPELQQHALSALRTRLASSRIQIENAKADLSHTMSGTNAALLSGDTTVAIPETTIRAAYPKPEADRLVADMQDNQQAGLLIKAMRWAPPDQLNTVMADLAAPNGKLSSYVRGTAATNKSVQDAMGLPAAASPDGLALPPETPDQTLRRQKIASLALDALKTRNAALTADPVSYVEADPTVHAAHAAAAANPAMFGDYVRASQATQRALGVTDANLRVLTTGQSAQLATTLLTSDPTKVDAGAQIDHLSKQFGDNWPGVWHDLVRDGHMPPEWQVLGSMAPGADRMQMQRALQAAHEKGGVENMRKDVDQVAAQQIDRDLDGALDDFRKTIMIPGLAGNPDLFTAVRGAVRTSALYGTLSGQSGSTPLDRAVAGTLPYDFVGLARAPKGSGGAAESYGNTVLSGLTPDKIGMARTGDPNMLPEQTQKAYISAVQRSGVWVTNERDDGWTLAVPNREGGYQLVVGPDGSRVGFKFKDIPSNQPPAPVPAANMPMQP